MDVLTGRLCGLGISQNWILIRVGNCSDVGAAFKLHRGNVPRKRLEHLGHGGKKLIIKKTWVYWMFLGRSFCRSQALFAGLLGLPLSARARCAVDARRHGMRCWFARAMDALPPPLCEGEAVPVCTHVVARSMSASPFFGPLKRSAEHFSSSKAKPFCLALLTRLCV